MRKLSGAKDKLGLRVHGLVVGSPEKQRADPAVLRALCSSYLPNGKVETLVSEFSDWASVQVGVWGRSGVSESALELAGALGGIFWRGFIRVQGREARPRPQALRAACPPKDGPFAAPVREPNKPINDNLTQADETMQYDWDDAEGNTRRRLAGLAREKARQAEMRRLRQSERRAGGGAGQSATLMEGVMSTQVNRGKKH
jgi:hypothetical protein